MSATKDPVVLVTGGTGALGTAVVAALLEGRSRVVSSWIAEAERDRLLADLGSPSRLSLVEADVTDVSSVDRLVGRAVAAGPLSAVVNLVGGFASGAKVAESDPAEFERMLRLNLLPTYLVSRASIPHLLEGGGGSIVAVSARAAVEPFSGAAGYIASKAAVLAFIRAIDAEYRLEGIRANAILPSVIDTPQNRAAMPNADHSGWVPPAQIAAVIRFLCSPQSAAISGAAIPV